MATSRIEGNLLVTGQLAAGSMVIAAGSVNSASIAAEGLDADTLEHQFQPTYGQSGSAASVTIPIHVVRGATATLLGLSAGSVAIAVGDSTVTIDIKKNGTTCLSAVVTLNSSSVAYTGVAGTITVPAGVVGDVYTLVVAATVGTGTLPTGLFVSAKFREDAD